MSDKMTAAEIRGVRKLIAEMRARTYFAEAEGASRVLTLMIARDRRATEAKP